jgi:hypothetical protein
MSLNIREVLHRRTDLSTFVVHLTRDRERRTARDALDSIFNERVLRAVTPMGWADTQDDPANEKKQTQRVVCFSETPLEHTYWLVANIEGRQVQMKPYGVALPKLLARRLGVNPIWYVDMTDSGRDWTIAKAIQKLRDEAVESGAFHDQDIAHLTPFFEPMLTWRVRGKQHEWWWEREWRHVGDLPLPDHGLIWLCPEDEMDSLRVEEPVIDPRWGLEQIIAHLAKFPADDVTPFAPPEQPPEDSSVSREEYEEWLRREDEYDLSQDHEEFGL